MSQALVHDRAAERDLIEIWVYTHRMWGEAQADRYLDALEAGIIKIARDPQSGRSRAAIREGYWSASIEHHVVFYTFSDSEVRVRRVLHESMDFDTHLPSE